MACIWIYNPRLTADRVQRESLASRNGAPTREILFRATEIYVHVSDGVVKIKDRLRLEQPHACRPPITQRQHIFLDTIEKTYRLINFNTTALGELTYSSNVEVRILMALRSEGWREHESQSN